MPLDAHDLASLAVRRAQLQRAISTAQGCGDSAWARSRRPALDYLDAKITRALKTLPSKVVEEARELTNASI